MDVLQRFVFDDAPVRGEYIYLHQSFQEILSQHPYPRPIQQLLGEILSVAGLLSAIIKYDGRVTVQFRGKGQLRMLLAQCTPKFQLRGLANWEGEALSHADLMSSIHEGILSIQLDSESGGNHYQGIVNWQGDSLAESVEAYFRDSEQLSTRLWLAVNENTAAGLLLQVIPGENRSAEETAVRPHWNRIIQQTQHLLPAQLLTGDYKKMLNDLYPEENVRIFTEQAVKFECSCSRQRSENAIYILGRDEADEELKDKASLVVTCDFCNKEYVFDHDDVVAIFANRDQPPSDTE